MQRLLCLGLSVAAVLVGQPAHGQGMQTGVITGLVRSTDGLPLPGVTVEASSMVLQGRRMASTDVNGIYSLRGLPPGTYSLAFSLSEFRPLTQEVELKVGGVTDASVTMVLATRAETVLVTGGTISPLSTRTSGRTYPKSEIDTLPVGRRPIDLAEFSPGLTGSPFNPGQVMISGGYAFDNVFMINGVDVNDNIFGTSNNLFIEDAIQEASVVTSAIPASYGRFSGGVINIVTKSGGNTFSGSFRENLSNPKWIDETPRETRNNIAHQDILNKSHEATFGGPVVRDRLWFFSAGRYERASTPLTFAQTGGSYTRADTNKRGELKLTGTIRPDHTLHVAYTNNSTQEANRGFSTTALLDASTLVTRQLPNSLLAVDYNATLGSALFTTLRYSQKKQSFRNNGGTNTDIGAGSPFRTLGVAPGVPPGLFYSAPYLDATDPEDRNNRQVSGSVSYLGSSERLGTHDLSGGFEHFISTGVGGNSQSPTGHVFVTDYVTEGGRPVVDSRGVPVARFIPGVSQVWTFLAARGARMDIKTTSMYVQDRWFVSPRLTLNLGARLESATGRATGDITTVDATTLAPRLGATFDITGEGRTIIQATYGHYSGKYSQIQFALNTNVGRPSEIDYVYTGPPGEGSSFAPDFDVRNYTQVVFANFPNANVRTASDLRSPVVREFTIGIGRELWQRGSVRATFVSRDTNHFVEDFIDPSRGTTNVPLIGQLTNKVLSNSDVPTREYQALITEVSYRTSGRFTMGGHHTLQIRNHGNFAGEALNQPGLASVLGDYPEVLGPALDRLMPEGRLDGFQRHKLRMFGTFIQSFGRHGTLALSPIWRVNSGAVYSLTSRITLRPPQLARNPGYPTNDINPNVRQTVYFGERGEGSFKGSGAADFAATYSAPVWKSVSPWLKVEIFNLFNNQKLIAWDTTVTPAATSAVDANGIPLGYVTGPRFGQATSDSHFPQPYPGQNGGRTFRMAFGVRF
jgi:hypothetical protein